MELRPESGAAKKKGGLNNLKNMISRGSNASMEEVKNAPPKSTEQLEAEIAALKAQLAKGGSGGTAEDLSTKPVLGYWNIRGLGQ